MPRQTRRDSRSRRSLLSRSRSCGRPSSRIELHSRINLIAGSAAALSLRFLDYLGIVDLVPDLIRDRMSELAYVSLIGAAQKICFDPRGSLDDLFSRLVCYRATKVHARPAGTKANENPFRGAPAFPIRELAIDHVDFSASADGHFC